MFTITQTLEGSWAAAYGPNRYALSGTFCHLMHVLHTRNFQ